MLQAEMLHHKEEEDKIDRKAEALNLFAHK
jgi:hypothetical protein